MKAYNCPDCTHTEDTCNNCTRTRGYYGEFKPVGTAIPRCCVNCSNHPINGGSGICNCVLPYMDESTTAITYTTELTIDK